MADSLTIPDLPPSPVVSSSEDENIKTCTHIVGHKLLTGRRELEWEVSEESLPGDVSHGAEDDHGPGEAGVAEADPLIGGELGHGLAPHQVLPVVLGKLTLIYKVFTTDFVTMLFVHTFSFT